MDEVKNLNPTLEVRQSEIAGMGLFAKEPIKKGDQVVVNVNYEEPEIQVLDDDAFVKFQQDCIEKGLEWDSVSLGNGRHRVAVSDRWNHPENFGNHSCDPNLDKDHVALRNIDPGEELTADYSEFSDVNWEMRCSCGAENCKGIVRGKVR